MQNDDMIEDTTEIEQGEHGINPLILIVTGVLVLICIIYFFTHIHRPV